MKLQETISILYRKYPAFRIGIVAFAAVAVIGILSAISIHVRRPPVIESITPPVGAPGDIMTITGHNFGPTQQVESFVEVGGSRITSSGYLNWQDTEIRVILPINVQDGLVLVRTKNGISKPGFFANEAGIPIAVPADTKTTLPVISSVSPATASPGALITLTGSNFGTIRNNAKVYFSANRDDADTSALTGATMQTEPGYASQNARGRFSLAYTPADESNYDYEYWSDTEIHVRVPDSAASGVVYVRTEKGESNHSTLQVHSPIGKKTFTERKTYLVQVTTDVQNQDPKNPATLTLRIPRPTLSAQQPMVEMTECKPQPLIDDYRNMIIQQYEFTKNGRQKQRFSQNFVIAVYSVHTEITERAVKPFSEKTRVLYSDATRADRLIKSDDDAIIQTAQEIVKKATNPYTQAKALYSYLLDTCTLTDSKQQAEPLSMLESKKGDAYDFAITFTTLARALGIPALPVSGILVDAALQAENHWWCEIYLENFGWLPVDPALGAGLTYKAFKQIEDQRSFYFGNLDSQHIAFSRGWNDVKPSFVNSKTVYRPHTYAFQPIWEESTSSSVNYSSLWNAPLVLGIY